MVSEMTEAYRRWMNENDKRQVMTITKDKRWTNDKDVWNYWSDLFCSMHEWSLNCHLQIVDSSLWLDIRDGCHPSFERFLRNVHVNDYHLFCSVVYSLLYSILFLSINSRAWVAQWAISQNVWFQRITANKNTCMCVPDDHVDFPIGMKIANLVKVHPMAIHP
jgi:hypothetical protein